MKTSVVLPPACLGGNIDRDIHLELTRKYVGKCLEGIGLFWEVFRVLSITGAPIWSTNETCFDVEFICRLFLVEVGQKCKGVIYMLEDAGALVEMEDLLLKKGVRNSVTIFIPRASNTDSLQNAKVGDTIHFLITDIKTRKHCFQCIAQVVHD